MVTYEQKCKQLDLDKDEAVLLGLNRETLKVDISFMVNDPTVDSAVLSETTHDLVGKRLQQINGNIAVDSASDDYYTYYRKYYNILLRAVNED